MSNIIIIGIDNGFGNTKSENTIIHSGVKVSDSAPIVTEDYYQIDDKYVIFGTEGLPLDKDKTLSEDTYHLTIAALLMELEHRELHNASVVLAVGLPLTWCSDDNKGKFMKYMKKRQVLNLRYKGEEYHIEVVDVMVFPQGYSAIASRFDMHGRNLIVDIGSRTVDSIMFKDGRPVEDSADTLEYGVEKCRENIRKDISKELMDNYDTDIIDEYLIKGCDGTENDATRIIARDAKEYCTRIEAKIKNYGYKEGLTKLYIMGGGARILKNYSDIGNGEGVRLVDDIYANAKGFANFARIAMKKNRSN